jgi:Bacterial HORMA domain 2
MVGTHATTTTYALTHSIRFMADNLLNLLRDLIRENGLSPDTLIGDREDLVRAITAWLASGHLTKVVIEFYRPGALLADARWDFPVAYTGSGVEDDMWRDKNYLRQLIAKAKCPSSDCSYRVVLFHNPGAPDVDGFSSCTMRGTGALVARQAGTAIATGHLTAGITYWR